MPNYGKLPGEEPRSASVSQNYDSSDEPLKAGLGELSPAAPTALSQPVTSNTRSKRKRAETHSDASEETQHVLMGTRNHDQANHAKNINASDHGRIHVGNNYYNHPEIVTFPA